MSKWKVAAYLRLSVDDDDNKLESNSITNQKSMIDLFLKKDKTLSLKDYYIDDGYSGTSFDRPDFKRMIEDIKLGKIDTVIVKDLSRLGRNYSRTGIYLEEIFPLFKIRFISLNDSLDTYEKPISTEDWRVKFKNLLNDEYARDISNKVRSILNSKKENGQFIGSMAPYGYLRDEKNKNNFIIDKSASKVVKKIFDMILDGKSRKEVIDELNRLKVLPPALYKMQASIYNYKISNKTMYEWTRRKLDEILTNQSYTGDLVQNKRKRISYKVKKIINTGKENWIIIPNHHTAIISREDFEKVQDIIYNRETRINKQNQLDVFSGHLRCQDCGNSLTIKKAKNHEYYYCTSFLKYKDCTKHSISKDKLSNIVLKLVNCQMMLVLNTDRKIKEISQKEHINYDLEILKDKLEKIENDISKYNLLKKSILVDFESEYITKEELDSYSIEYSEKIMKLKEEKEIAQKELDKIGNGIIKSNRLVEKFNSIGNIDKLTKKIVDELIEYIYVSEDSNLKIVFKHEDEFNCAIDFIKNHKCDIMEENCQKIINEEVK